MEQYKSYAKNVVLMGITQFVLGLQGFLLLPILTKFLGATDFGIWSQIKITLILLSSIAPLGLESSIVRFMSGEQNKKKISKEFLSIILIVLASSLILGLIVFASSEKIGELLTQIKGTGHLFKFILLMLVLWPLHNLSITFLRAKNNILIFSIIELTRAITEIGLIYIFLNKGYGLIGVISAYILVKFTIIIIEVIYLKKYIFITKPSYTSVKPFLNFSLPLTITPLLFWILQTGDQYIIGYYVGAKAVGIYALSYSLCRIIRTIADPILLLLQPSISSAWNQNKIEEVKKYFTYSYKYIFMLVIPAIFGLCFLSEPILRIIATEEFVEGHILIPLISIGVGIYLLFSLAVGLLMLTKETKKIPIILLILAALNIGLNILLVPWLHYYGAAVSTFLTFCLAGIYGVTIIKNRDMPLLPLFILKCTFSSVVMSGFIVFVRTLPVLGSMIKLFIIATSSAIIYFIILYIIKGINLHEIKFFLRMFSKT